MERFISLPNCATIILQISLKVGVVMKIGVIGGGSIGLLFTSYLAKSAHAVTLFVRREAQQQAIHTMGLTLKAGSSAYTSQPKVCLLSETDRSDIDVLIVAVKSYDVEQIMPEIIEKFRNTRSILFVQNGMQHLRFLPHLKMHSIYMGVVEHGAMKESDHLINHTGVGRTKIAPYLDGHSGINWEKLSKENFPFFYQNDWYAMVSEKLHINAVINPLTAILRIPNGALLTNTHWLELMEQLSKEACKVLNIKYHEAWKDLVAVCENTSLNKSSMLRDIENKRRTEIEAINGFILNSAEGKNIEVPNNRFVYQIIKGMEE
ncbi:2-dehydropantoate 2-reductase [Alkalihalobacillus sp. TS-13]|uniref:2-dehydropantoate 2-reductase n=1 Tax=Alkalihalobacillus sp. TS-13 TaxID=2842455 RepID=UPI001C8896A3|nr:2-dehydropantoate 2-reductase [Alkalihalobacillus sp. TS-13]